MTRIYKRKNMFIGLKKVCDIIYRVRKFLPFLQIDWERTLGRASISSSCIPFDSISDIAVDDFTQIRINCVQVQQEICVFCGRICALILDTEIFRRAVRKSAERQLSTLPMPSVRHI